MNPAAYTTASEKAAERYLVVLAALQSVLFAYMAQPFSEASMRALRMKAKAVAQTFAETEVTLIRMSLTDTAQNAQERVLDDLDVISGATIPEAQKAFLEQSVDHLSLEVRSQLSRDVETIVLRYREQALEAQLAAYARGLVKPAITIGQGDQNETRFYFRDRAGRQSKSDSFIRVAWRQSLVSLGAEFYLMEAVNRGAKQIIVTHPDPEHQFQGVEISLTDEDGQSFTDIRDTIFHPMTSCVLKASF